MNQLRKIRSFTYRQRALSQSQQCVLKSLWCHYGLDLAEISTPLKLTKIFKNNQLTILEIGFGNGNSLVKMASAHSYNNYLGVEVYEAGIRQLMISSHKQSLRNIRVINADSTDILENYIADASLGGVQVFFPDPWPKKKHHKRRIIQMDFLTLLATKLKPNGFLHIATDWQNYAQHIEYCCQQHVDFRSDAGGTILLPSPGFRPLTKFEMRGILRGHKIYDFFVRRII